MVTGSRLHRTRLARMRFTYKLFQVRGRNGKFQAVGARSRPGLTLEKNFSTVWVARFLLSLWKRRAGKSTPEGRSGCFKGCSTTQSLSAAPTMLGLMADY